MTARSRSATTRRKSVRAPSPDPSEDPSEDPEETSPEEGLSGAGSLFEKKAGEEAYYLVYRRDDITRELVFQFRLADPNVTVERIQELRGGGEYQIKEKRQNEQGSFVYGRQRQVVIDGPPKKLEQIPEIAPLDGTAASPSAAVPVGVLGKPGVDVNDIMSAGILNLFQAQQSIQAAVLEQVKSMHDRPQINWAVMATALSPLLVKLLDRGPQAPQTDPVKLAMEIATIVKEGVSPPAQLKDQLEVVNSFLDIKERVMPGTDDPVIALATTYLPKLIEVVQEEQRRRGQSPTSTAELEKQMQRRVASKAEVPAVTGGEVPVWQRLLTQRLKVLVKMAAQGKDPEVIADYEYEMLPDEYRGTVREWIAREDVLGLIEQWVPEAKQFPQWVEQFVMRLRELFYGMESEVEEEQPGPEEKVDQVEAVEGETNPEQKEEG